MKISDFVQLLYKKHGLSDQKNISARIEVYYTPETDYLSFYKKCSYSNWLGFIFKDNRYLGSTYVVNDHLTNREEFYKEVVLPKIIDTSGEELCD